jgi:hypothetical protein
MAGSSFSGINHSWSCSRSIGSSGSIDGISAAAAITCGACSFQCTVYLALPAGIGTYLSSQHPSLQGALPRASPRTHTT